MARKRSIDELGHELENPSESARPDARNMPSPGAKAEALSDPVRIDQPQSRSKSDLGLPSGGGQKLGIDEEDCMPNQEATSPPQHLDAASMLDAMNNEQLSSVDHRDELQDPEAARVASIDHELGAAIGVSPGSAKPSGAPNSAPVETPQDVEEQISSVQHGLSHDLKALYHERKAHTEEKAKSWTLESDDLADKIEMNETKAMVFAFQIKHATDTEESLASQSECARDKREFLALQSELYEVKSRRQLLQRIHNDNESELIWLRQRQAAGGLTDQDIAYLDAKRPGWEGVRDLYDRITKELDDYGDAHDESDDDDPEAALETRETDQVEP